MKFLLSVSILGLVLPNIFLAEVNHLKYGIATAMDAMQNWDFSTEDCGSDRFTSNFVGNNIRYSTIFKTVPPIDLGCELVGFASLSHVTCDRFNKLDQSSCDLRWGCTYNSDDKTCMEISGMENNHYIHRKRLRLSENMLESLPDFYPVVFVDIYNGVSITVVSKTVQRSLLKKSNCSYDEIAADYCSGYVDNKHTDFYNTKLIQPSKYKKLHNTISSTSFYITTAGEITVEDKVSAEAIVKENEKEFDDLYYVIDFKYPNMKRQLLHLKVPKTLVSKSKPVESVSKKRSESKPLESVPEKRSAPKKRSLPKTLQSVTKKLSVLNKLQSVPTTLLSASRGGLKKISEKIGNTKQNE